MELTSSTAATKYLEVVDKNVFSLTSFGDTQNKLYSAITIQEIDIGKIMLSMMCYALVILIPYPLWSSSLNISGLVSEAKW
jgi:hypothetical protein